MKDLQEYIEESLLDDLDTLSKNVDEEIKQKIKQFLKDNVKGASKCKISKKPNDDGKYVVDYVGDVEVKNKSITSLTNDLFVWGTVGGDFSCHSRSLKTLEGAPKEVGGDFECYNCHSLTSLIGAPEKVWGNFDCRYCESLKTLEGAPKEVGGDFDCSYCTSLKLYNIDSNIKGKFIK